MDHISSIILGGLLMACPAVDLLAQAGNKPASHFTNEINQAEYARLDFADSTDYHEATRGFIATIEDGIIYNSKGEVATNINYFGFIQGEAPATVNPALWRHAGLNTIHGLFEVTDGIWQVRGFDLTNITFVRTGNGFLVIDPVTNPNATKAAYELVKKHIADLPVVAIISTHSHSDHFAGIAGLVDQEAITSGSVQYIAPAGFYEEAVSENVLLGNAMSRRSVYQFAPGIPAGPTGIVDNGLGKYYVGKFDPGVLWKPTVSVDHTGQVLHIDGLEVIFQYTPETEAPAEMMFYIPAKKAFFCAELATRTLHNLLPPRGTKVRDARSWAAYLNESVELFGDELEYVIPAHSWPFFGRERGLLFLEKQRDLYKYIHDQTIHLANKGLNPEEIATTITLPASLDSEWFNQDFYGAVKHNVKAVYQYYLGWYDGHPANYNRLPPAEEATRYIAWFGGEEATLEKARQSFEEGDYQWVVQALKWLAFTNPDNKAAKELQADAFEQLGYQSRSSIWRNMYLTAAKELREGNVTRNAPPIIKRFIRDLSADDLFTYLSVAIDGTRAAGKELYIRFNIEEEETPFWVYLSNGVLHHTVQPVKWIPQLEVILSEEVLKTLIADPNSIENLLSTGTIHTQGDQEQLKLLVSLIEVFNLDWNIVTR